MPIRILSIHRDSMSHIRDSVERPTLPHGSHAGTYAMGPLYMGAIGDVPALLAILVKTVKFGESLRH